MLSTPLTIAQAICDRIAEIGPPRSAATDELANARLIGHRGATGPGPDENRLASFADCARAGVWGVELDVRWSRDQVPFVLHDETLTRTFSHPAKLANSLAPEVRKSFPELPQLSEVIAALRGHCHLMIETKEILSSDREAILSSLLEGLSGGRDFHILTLDPRLVGPCQKLPRSALIMVTELNVRRGSDLVLSEGWGGVAGHYLLMNDRLIDRHHQAGQRVGVGFVAGFNNLCRQLRRGVDWIFTNKAVNLQQMVRSRLDRS